VETAEASHWAKTAEQVKSEDSIIWIKHSLVAELEKEVTP